MSGDLLNRNVNDCVDPVEHVMNIRAASALTPVITAVTGAEADTGAYYDFSGVTPGDLLFHEAGANGRVATGIANDPIIVGGKSSVVLKQGFGIPHQFDIEASADQAVRADYQSIEVFGLKDDGTADNMPAPTPCIITSIQQTTTTLTIQLDQSTPYDGWVGTWVNINGCIDNRLNYFNLCIASVSIDRLWLTATVADESTLPSLTVGPYSGGTLGTATLTRDDQIGGARNGYSLRFSGTSTTAAALISRFDGDSAQKSGTLAGIQTITVASRAVAFDVQSNGQIAPRPNSHYRIVADPLSIALLDSPADSIASSLSARLGRTNVKPWARGRYGMRLSMIAPASMPRPVAKVVSAVKAGSTTATITTDVPLASVGIVTGTYVMPVGQRDQANFANATTAVAVTVTGANTFTCAYGASATATTYGGSVILANGGYGQPGLVTQAAQSVARDAAGLVTVVGSASWSGVAPGQYINLHGIRDASTGADLGFDGVYYVLATTTTTMILGPVTDIRAAVLGPALANIAYPATPTGAVVTTTNCGGSVIVRTTTRSHDFNVFEWKQNLMQIEGQGTSRADRALPVVFPFTMPVNVAQISGTTPGTLTMSGGTNRATAIASASGTLNADVTSSARTTSSNSGTIADEFFGTVSGLINCSASSGTSPTLDIALQESHDNGTTYEDIWHAERITGVTVIPVPAIPVNGKRRWAWTIAGTSPSFTFGISAMRSPAVVPLARQFFDRTAGLLNGTLNAVSGWFRLSGLKNYCAKITLGAATTPGTYQLQVSDDRVNAAAASAAVPAVASSTILIPNTSGAVGQYGRIICTSAATGQTGTLTSIHGSN